MSKFIVREQLHWWKKGVVTPQHKIAGQNDVSFVEDLWKI
jgi:hypothetical protein